LRNLRRMAQYIRHLPGLERAEWLWAAARGPYHRVLGAGGHGVEVKVGGTAAVRMPPAFSGGAWETFEPEAVAALADWVRRHPGGLVLDIGSSIGIFSAIALSAGDDVEVVAFDPDLASLAAVQRLCAHADGQRLRLVHGFVTQAASETASLEEAAARTQAALIRTGIRGEVGTTRYASLTDAVPRWRLDDLCAGLAGRPTLVKCDVEGAELLVLAGGEALLRRVRPDLLLSVHPPALPGYGHSKAEAEAFLRRLGYDIRCLAVDHEEHWWCEPRT
jgi:FkbM family methyltransferase